MISPEVLRRYPFFAFMSHEQLRDVAMLTDEITAGENEVLFAAGATAVALYFLRQGNVELHYVVVDERGMEKRQDFLVGMINPGEILGISALIEPYEYTASAVVTEPSQLLKLDAVALRELCDADPKLAAGWQRRIAATTMARLHDTRIQLLAAA